MFVGKISSLILVKMLMYLTIANFTGRGTLLVLFQKWLQQGNGCRALLTIIILMESSRSTISENNFFVSSSRIRIVSIWRDQ